MSNEQETREKECGNLLDKEREQGSRYNYVRYK